jgi:hypothetical protein
MKKLLVLAALLALVAVPALAGDDDKGFAGRWDPSGTYVLIDDEGACVTEGTTILVQVWPVDHAKNHYLVIQDRQNNLVTPNYSDMGVGRGDMWRTGKNSFKWSSIMYTRDANNEPNSISVSTGAFLRKPNGELVTEDFYYYVYLPWDNPLDPEAEPIAAVGPCEMTWDGKLEYVPPPEE